MTRDELLALMDHFSASVLHRMEYEEGDTRIVLEKAPIAPVAPLTAVAPAAVPAMAPAPTAPAEQPCLPAFLVGAEQIKAEGSVIKAPLVGTFYAAPSPEVAPFVKAGDTVKKNDTVCILEAMKMMSEVPAPCDCVIEEVLSASGELVGFGQPLFRIREL